MLTKLFKKKSTEVYQPIIGQLIPLEEVSDPVFSQKMMGDGFAVKPEVDELYSPIKGIVKSIFPTKHALIIKSDAGIEVLIHIGIDTVELAGEGFVLFVKEGQAVDKDTQIAKIDFTFIHNKGKSTDVLVLFPDLKDKTVTFDLSGEIEPLATIRN
ncbi:PTS sugar transporter subunit IIA [Enterococcus sp. AZ109]|uniref:PTS sugar transporter subunit IIA n=1 Tax=Enterococcus sp. AZ109 TaxID=2774634 RepID=UPI003F244789